MKEYINTILETTTIVPNTILEIGSRDGHDSNTLKTYFNIKDNNVWVVEPNPAQSKKIKNSYPNFNLFETAIYDKNTTIEFNCVEDVENVGVSSILDRNDNFYIVNNTKKIIVSTITGKQLLSTIQKDIDLCKIDVEGVTYEVINSFNDQILRIKSMHIECEHIEVWKNQKLFTNIEQLLIKNNFKMVFFKFVGADSIQSDSVWVNKKYIK